MAKAFSPRLGVLSGLVFQRRSPEDTTLSESRYSRWLFKVGTSSHNWFTIGVKERMAPSDEVQLIFFNKSLRADIICLSPKNFEL
jgi:hypothetical protein